MLNANFRNTICPNNIRMPEIRDLAFGLKPFALSVLR